MKINKLFYTCLLFILPAPLMAQTVLERSMEQYRRQVFQEKLYVHTDKDFYLAGEIMWLKAYAVDATWHQLSDLNKVAYVDVLDQQQRPVLQAKIELKEGIGNGSAYMPVQLNTGTYKLRAYTSWMKNFDASGYYEKTLTVVNSQKVPAPETTDKPAFDVRFYPEGGRLVKDLQSRVAFTVSGAVSFTGAVLDQFNDTVVTFAPYKNGMGSFMLTPRENRVYHAVIRPQGGAPVTAAMPEISKEGYVMQLAADGNNIRVQVSTAGIPGGTVYLLAHTREQVKVGESRSLQDGKATFVVDASKLGAGVTHFTLFNMDRQPLCERLYFKKPATLDIDMQSDKPLYGLRQPVQIDVKSAEAQHLSMAVYRLDSLQQPQASDITAALYLEADAGGYVPDAAALMNDNMAMDYLMLTRGWRRFKWSEVLSDTKPAFRFAPEFNGHLITGKVTDTRTGQPAKDVATYLSIPGTNIEFYTSLSDAKGNVRYDVRDFYGSNEVIAQTDGQKDSAFRIDIHSPFSDSVSAGSWPQFMLTEQYEQTLIRRNINMQVQNIYTGTLMKKIIPPQIDTSAFYGRPDARYMLDDYTRFATMEEVLREYVPGVNVRRRGGRFAIMVLNAPDKNFFTANPLVLLDGVPVFNMDKLLAYDPLKVRKLETLTKRYFLGQLYFDGVLNFTTYKGDINGYELDANATVVDYEGLQAQREFYAPQYGNAEALSGHLPDYRNQLYWAPELGKNSRQTFYTSDLPGRYVVVLQALGVNGKTGSRVIYFDVKE